MKIFAFADEASPWIDGQIRAMLHNSLQGLEIRGVDGVNIADISLEKAGEVRQKLEDTGLSCWSIGSPIGKIGIEEDFEAHLKKFRHTLALAQALGAGNIRLFSFYLPQGGDPEAYREEVIRRLMAFAQAARGTGIGLCHENEKGIYGDTALRCLDIHRAVPEIKAVFDPANFVQCGQDTRQAWELLKPYVHYLHIKDALTDGKVVPAGKGIGNVPWLLQQFAAIGGDSITIEPHLTVFQGLKELDKAGDTSTVGGYVYSSPEEAFNAACRAVRSLVPN